MAQSGKSAQMSSFSWSIRVYYEDSDVGGVVYHAQYLKFLERARTEWLRALGYEQSALRADFKLIFVVKSLAIEYIKPAYFNDLLEVQSRIVAVKKASMDFIQTINRADEALLQAELTVVCVTTETFKPHAIPSCLFEDLSRAR